jgi:hypothetical protein
MRAIPLILALCFFSFFAKSQVQKSSIHGILLDSATAQSIPYATVSVFNAADTTLISYRLSDDKGEFHITALPTSVKLRVLITYMGFTVYRKALMLSPDQLELGKIMLNVSSKNLAEVTVRAERPPVIVRKDTIEFNAASFKTLPDALVEDLLRKLPGVNVDKDGNILVNGRRVSTIYVDGKDFFGGDIRIASKNLPANTIDKVQVSNDTEALRFNPFMPEADIPQVINLKLKPGIKKGVFGKSYAGGGVKDKYEIGALLNLFRDTTQISVIGYGNNLNKSSFSFNDIKSIGGFNRSGYGNANGNGNGGLSIDKVSFGGFGSGLMNSTGGGGNFNTIINKKVQFNLNYFYGAVTSNYDELRNTKQSYSDTLLNTRQNMMQQSDTYAHMVGTRVAFNLNPKLRLEFKPQFVFTKENTNQFFDISSESNIKGLLNLSQNNQQNDNNGFTYMSWTKLMPTFTKKGRNLDIFNYTVIDNTNANLLNNVNNVFFQPPSQDVLNQLRRNDTRNANSTLYARYTDLLSNTLTLSSGLTVAYFRNQNDLGTFFPNGDGEYLIAIPTLTEDYVRTGLKVDATASIKWKLKKLTFGPGIGLSTYDARNNFSTTTPLNQHFVFALPSFDLGYGIFNLSYQTSFREPSLINLQPVVNNTNPLFIRQGNPDLKPAYNNSLSLSLRKYDTKRFMTYNVSFNGTTVKNATIISRTVSKDGIQTTYPLNSNGTWNFGNSISFQKDWKLPENRQISIIASNNSSLNQSIVMLNQVKSQFKTLTIRPAAELRINLNDKFEFNQAYNFSHYQSRYDNPEFINQSLTYHDSRTEIIVRFAQKVVLESSMDYHYNSNAVPGLLKDYYKWNAAVTYIFLKGNRGQLKFAVNDILDQNILASRTVRENLIEDMQGSTIRRYGLLTFTYNIRNFGGKIGGKNDLFK